MKVVRRNDAHVAVVATRSRDGGNRITVGSHILRTDLLAAALVHEIHLMTGDVSLRDGVAAGVPTSDAYVVERPIDTLIQSRSRKNDRTGGDVGPSMFFQGPDVPVLALRRRP